MTDRRLGLAVLLIGFLAIGVAQRTTPARLPPLFDGVVSVDPYRWLVPPAGQQGDPKSATGTADLDKGASPLLAIATAETPPQAQIFATSGAMILPGGTTKIRMSIAPILPRTLPTTGHIAGNVYRIAVTNQAGVPLTAPADQQVTVVLRGPPNTHDAQIEQLTDTGWQALATADGGFASTFIAVVTGFGDFALVAPGPGDPYPTATPTGATGAPSAAPSASAPSTGIPSAVAPSPSAGPVAPAAGTGPPIVLWVGVVAAVLAGAAVTTAYTRRRQERVRAEEAKRRRKKQARPRRR